MRAVLVERFGSPASVTTVADPAVAADGVVLSVAATGLCRSDWHGWLGHDPDIVLPHVPGHEFAGTIVGLGPEVRGWSLGDRVTAPFVCACGQCAQCAAGNQQVCLAQQQPGFTYWGSFAEYVAVPKAEVNLVAVPDELDLDAAAALGCRFATAYRGITAVARVRAGEQVAVFGCGGVGLSAVMIAAAAGAEVIAVDRAGEALELARSFGASAALISGADTADQIRELTHGGADVSVDALGAAEVVQAALRALRPRGRLVQIGLLPSQVSLDLGVLIGRELQWLGSHGMAAADYPAMLAQVADGTLRPADLVRRTLRLDDVPAELEQMSATSPPGISVIHP